MLLFRSLILLCLWLSPCLANGEKADPPLDMDLVRPIGVGVELLNSSYVLNLRFCFRLLRD